MLKGVVKHRMVGNARDGSSSDATTLLERSDMEKNDFGLMAAIQAAQRSFIITDPALNDNPIIFASKGFLEMSGYLLENVLGRNCRFLQGPGTDISHIEMLRKGIAQGEDTSVCLVNYKADGTPFYNQVCKHTSSDRLYFVM